MKKKTGLPHKQKGKAFSLKEIKPRFERNEEDVCG